MAGRTGNKSVSHGDVVASHARSVEGYFPNAQSLLDSPVYERRVILLRYARNCYELRRRRDRRIFLEEIVYNFSFLEGKGEGKGRRWLRCRRRKYSLSLNRCQISVFDIRLIKFNCNYPNQWNLARSSISHARYIQLQR